MSHFFFLVDPDPDRRAASMRRARTELQELGLTVETCEKGNASAAWCRARAWPAKHSVSSNSVCLVMGQALRDGHTPVEPDDLATDWQLLPGEIPQPYDGIHMTVLARSDEVYVAADPLGRFPVYYQAGADQLLLASSPELFRCHPMWKADVDPEGLASLLLLNYFRDGKTLWAGVRRMGHGNMLIWSGGEVRERMQYRLQLTDELWGKSFEKQCEAVEAAFQDAIHRHLPDSQPFELFCSGGLDSRMLAGYLGDHPALSKAITWGNSDDFEMRCAKKVVRNLGIAHECWPVQTENYPLFARKKVKFESLSTGFNALSFMQDRCTAPAPGGFVSGQAMDCAIGGTVVINQELKTGCESGFEQLLARENGWAIPVQVLPGLLRKGVFGDAADAVLHRMRRDYESFSRHEFQRINAYSLLHRHRFHTTAVIGLHGLWGWPVLPAFDRKVLQVLGGISKESFFQRRIQKHLVCTRFPDLARIPLDKNSNEPRALLPRSKRWEDFLLRFDKKISKLTGADKQERRFYYRIMDFNSPEWRAVRRKAEPGRELLRPFFNASVFDSIVPPPDELLRETDIAVNPLTDNPDRIKATSGAKLLTGLMLWAEAGKS